GVAPCPRERVVDEQRKVTPEAPVSSKQEPVVSRVRRRLEIVDVALSRVRPQERVRQRSVYVSRPKKVNASRVDVSERAGDAKWKLVLDAALSINRVRRLERRIEGANELPPRKDCAAGVRAQRIVGVKDGVSNNDALKIAAIITQCVLIKSRAEPIEEQPSPGSHDCLLGRRPCDAQARLDVELVLQVRLKLITQPCRDRHIGTKANIILNEEGRFILVVVEEGIAQIDCELRRTRKRASRVLPALDRGRVLLET